MTDETTVKNEKTGGAIQGKDLLLGIDLGTSRTAIMSNRGAKSMFRSVVGYPKDIIAVKLIQNTQLIGDEALDNAQSLNLYMPLENGMIKRDATEKDLGAVRALFDHALQAAAPQDGDRKCAVIGVPAEASVKNIDILLDLAKDIFDIALVVSEPFLVAYSLNKIVNSIVVDIGAGTTDICILKGALPSAKDQMSSFVAGDYLDRQFEDEILNSHPNIQLTRNQVRKVKEQFAFVGDNKDKVVVRLRERGRPVEIDVSKELRLVCEEIVPGIVEEVEKMIIAFNPEKQEEALRNIFLSGGGSQIKGLDAMVAGHLKEFGEVKVTCVTNPDYAGCDGALQLATDVPPENWDKIGPVCGI